MQLRMCRTPRACKAPTRSTARSSTATRLSYTLLLLLLSAAAAREFRSMRLLYTLLLLVLLSAAAAREFRTITPAKSRRRYDKESSERLRYGKGGDFVFRRYQSPAAVRKSFEQCRTERAFKPFAGKDGRKGVVGEGREWGGEEENTKIHQPRLTARP